MDEGWSIQLEQARTWKRRKGEIPMVIKAKGIRQIFCFVGEDTVECVVWFKIDSHTIKREIQNSKYVYLVPLGVNLHAFALDLVKM